MEDRKWLYNKIKEASDLPDEQIYASGALTGKPKALPAIVIRLDGTLLRPPSGGHMEEVQIWVHDSSGSYLEIDRILEQVRAQISDSIPGRAYGSDGIVLEWLGKSGDLFDDEWNTITRHHDYQLVTSR